MDLFQPMTLTSASPMGLREKEGILVFETESLDHIDFNALIAQSRTESRAGIPTHSTSTAELLQLLANLRLIASQFPPEVQEEITIDIEDLEAEIQKPADQRNPTRLKKRLTALLLAGTTIATPIAGMTDFANNLVDLGNKVGIELQLPAAS